MNILVTGTSGFIAKKLAAKLKKARHTVYCLDKTSSGLENEIVLDISDKDFVKNFPSIQVDYIFHLAAQSGGYYSLVDPYIDATWNAVGTVNIAALGKKLNIKKLIYASSMAVYGNAINATENNTLPNPISFYGVSKYAGELQAKILKEHSNIPYTIFRLFATYGAGQDLTNKHQGILSIYIDQLIKSDTIRITGSKHRVRELVHVDDVVQALLLGMDNRTDNEIYNVSNPEQITPVKIIQEISNQLNKEAQILELDGYVGDQTYITSSVEKLKALGWTPSINLKNGVKEFLDNIK